MPRGETQKHKTTKTETQTKVCMACSISRAASIYSDDCRLPTTSVLSNKADKLRSKFLKATHRTKIRKIEIPRSMVVEALN